MLGKNFVIVSGVLGLLAILYCFNMAYFSFMPSRFIVEQKPGASPGVVFTDVIIRLAEQELSGPGGWTPNDIFPSPAWLLDNKPNFQLGVLEAVRYSARAMRDSLARQRTTDTIDADCDQAFTSFSNDPHKWMMPSAEGKYAQGIKHLKTYSQRLQQGTASFYPRSDNLIQLLEQYASLLGGVNTRLLNASRTDVSRATYGAEEARSDGQERLQKVPWVKIDDNFYYAQGVGYGLCHLLQAMRAECAGVLRDKNAMIIMNEIVGSLEEAYFEPAIITNGGKAGVLANHSNNLRVFLDDARQKSNSLISMLDQG